MLILNQRHCALLIGPDRQRPQWVDSCLTFIACGGWNADDWAHHLPALQRAANTEYGTRAAAHFESDIEICRWPLRATLADRQTRDYPAVDLCSTVRVDLR